MDRPFTGPEYLPGHRHCQCTRSPAQTTVFRLARRGMLTLLSRRSF